MAEQINRERLDDVAARGWLADQAAANHCQAAGLTRAPVILGAALIRLGGWLQGTVRPAGTPAKPAAFPAR